VHIWETVDRGCTKLQKYPCAVAKFAWRDGGNGIGFSQDSGLSSYDPVMPTNGRWSPNNSTHCGHYVR